MSKSVDRLEVVGADGRASIVPHGLIVSEDGNMVLTPTSSHATYHHRHTHGQQQPAASVAAEQPAASVAAEQPAPGPAHKQQHRPSTAAHVSSGAASITIAPSEAPSSIYDLRSNRKRRLILLAAAIASVLVPLTDTIYLPALKAVGRDLIADASLVAASVSIYMLAVGVGSLLWGPMADRFGRRITYWIGSAIFLGTSIGCIFAPTIGVLVAFRALQGLAVAAYQTTGQGVIADVFPPQVRGTALGVFMIPLLVGPLAGPLLGGVLSQEFGWRSTFICLTVFAGGIVLPMLLVLVPETHQRKLVQRLRQRDPAAAEALSETEAIMAQQLVFSAPWVPLKYLVEGDVAPYAALCFCTFGCMFASLTEWPGVMAAAPYSLSEALIGVSYLAMGVAGLVGSPLGGRTSDMTASKWPRVPEARMVYNTAAALVLMPIGLLIYGWTLQHKTHLVGPLVGHFVIGTASAAYLPGIFGYLSTIKQQNASAAAAAVNAGMFALAAVLISVSVPGVYRLGLGWYFTLLAGAQLVLGCIAALSIWRRYHAVYGPAGVAQQQQQQQQLVQSRMKAISSRVELLQAAEEGESTSDSAVEADRA